MMRNHRGQSGIRVLVSGLTLLGVACAWGLVANRPAIAEESQPEQDGYQRVVSCVGLTAPSWKNHEVETTLDMHNGLLTVVYFGVDDSDVLLTVRYEDPACEENPTLRDLIHHAVSTANEDIAGDCRALEERLATGNFTVRERTLDPAAVVAYIERWCQ